MSINVTVTGNPINIRRSRMVLSDLEKIKKCERERRRRLRLKQARQQMNEISHRVLERAKLTAQQELEKQNDANSELRSAQNKKLVEIQQKYQEDMENIGQAHALAAQQPNVDKIIEMNKERNKAIASERGKEAAQNLKELNKKKEEQKLQVQERLHKVREMENVRAAMISQLPRTSHSKDDEIASDLSQSDESLSTNLHLSRNMKLVNAEVHQADKNTQMNAVNNTERHSDITKPIVVDVYRKPRQLVTCESDDQQPRRTPAAKFSSTKTDKTMRYNPNDYKQGTSETDSTSSTSSISNDSSYFSDNGDHVTTKRTAKLHTSPSSSKIQMYDLRTRQRNTYNMPMGLVEKIDIRNEPNAEDRAKELTMSKSHLSELNEKRKIAAKNRGKDALLREKVRRDYKALLRNLDDLCREERKLKASQIQNLPKRNMHAHSSKKKELEKKRQRKMERVVESTLRSTNEPPVLGSVERVITITPRNESEPSDISPSPTWQKSSTKSTMETLKDPELKLPNEETSRNEQILDMLKKVERQKFLLLKEYGANLPESIFNASLRPLLEHSQQQQGRQIASTFEEKNVTSEQKISSPVIRVINMSNCDDTVKMKPVVSKTKQKSLQLTETAVQTSVTEEAQDKSVQVEFSEEKNTVSEIVHDDIYQHPLEPTVKIVTPIENISSSSGSSFVTDIVIDMNKQQVKVTPKKKRHSSKKVSLNVSKKSLSIGKVASPAKKSLKPPASRVSTPRKSTSTVPSKRDFSQMTSIESSSTESSRVYSTPDAGHSEGAPYRIQTRMTKKIIRIRDTSDSSTSYASPPTMQAGALISAINNSTSILELLDSSAAENHKQKMKEVSPVSTPETPSPRTMKLPSNVARSEKISKTLFRQVHQDSSNSAGRKSVLQRSQKSQYTSTSLKHQKPTQECTCKNPTCKLFHAKKLDQIDEFILTNYPDVAKKLEELQMTSEEKIASLSGLIEKLRNERGTEMSAILPIADDISIQPMRNPNIETVRNLINSIENVHSKLAKTLKESERLISGEIGVPRLSSFSDPSTSQKFDEILIEESSNTKNNRNDVENIQNSGIKPTIISDEYVHIDLSRFKTMKKSRDKDEMVEKLSKEILEQSKSVDKLHEPSDDSDIKQDKEGTKSFMPSNKFACALEKDEKIQCKREPEFKPILSGIYENSQVLRKHSAHGSKRPPPTAANGIYRSDIITPAHELSTIIELDTPDAGSRTQSTIKSPLSKCRRNSEQSKKSDDHMYTDNIPPLKQHMQSTPRKSLTPRTSTPTKSSTDDMKKTKDDYSPHSEKRGKCTATDEKSAVTEHRYTNLQTSDSNGSSNSQDKMVSISSNSLSGFSGISEITSTSTSETSKSEIIERILQQNKWASSMFKKNQEAEALESTTNSDATPVNTARRTISPKKQMKSLLKDISGLTDLSSISINEASKSTEHAVLQKGRTSTPNVQLSSSNTDSSNSSTTTSFRNSSNSDSFIVPDLSLPHSKTDSNKQKPMS